MQDVHNPNLEKAVALSIDVPQSFKFTTFYNIPIGRGQLISLHGPLDWIAGGWTISAILHYRSGLPLHIVDSGVNNGIFATTRPNYTGLPVKINKHGYINFPNSTGPQYLNPAAFTHVKTSCDLVAPGTPCNNVALTTGDVPSALGNVQAPGLAQESASLQKNFPFGPSRSFQLRIDGFNILNRAGRGAPVTDINSPKFGQILNNQYGPRIVQLQGRIFF